MLSKNKPRFSVAEMFKRWEVLCDRWSAEVQRLRAREARMKALLKRLEWRGGSGDCPDCCGWNDAGGKHHKPDCELAALLRAK